MKSTVTPTPEPPADRGLTFPLLARFKSTGMVVLFSSQYRGTVVNSGFEIEGKNVGTHSATFVSIHSHAWEILAPGAKVTLEQE